MLLQSVSYCDDLLIIFLSTPCLRLLPGNGMCRVKKFRRPFCCSPSNQQPPENKPVSESCQTPFDRKKTKIQKLSRLGTYRRLDVYTLPKIDWDLAESAPPIAWAVRGSCLPFPVIVRPLPARQLPLDGRIDQGPRSIWSAMVRRPSAPVPSAVAGG
jgi:hypothetical protein